MKLSPVQEDAVRKVADWYSVARQRHAGYQRIFRMFGYAGTGKTTLAKYFADSMDAGMVQYAAFTGKAVRVLQNKGCDNAKTLHSLIYKPREDEQGRIEWVINPMSPLHQCDLLVVDECSMVGDDIGNTLIREFNIPILVLGDPAQLPPVSGEGFFINKDPDVMLEEIHRQAAENPIIRLSMDIRTSQYINPANYGKEVMFMSAHDAAHHRDEIIEWSDQVLCGTNKMRHTTNTRIRSGMGREMFVPEVGDKMICLKNNHPKGLQNGSMWECDNVGPRSEEIDRGWAPEGRPRPADTIRQSIYLGMTSTEVNASVNVLCLMDCFNGNIKEVGNFCRKGLEEFDFGYAITVHKAQGSQWDRVLLYDESHVFREDHAKHFYTAVTRAAEEILIVR